MEAVRNAASKQNRPGIYNDQLKQLAQIRELYNQAAVASGDFHVQTVKTVSASQALTESIQGQKLGWKQARAELNAYKTGGQSALRELIKEQTALKQAMVTQFGGNISGKNPIDMFIPKNLGTELENSKIKYGAINQMLRSAATQTVNWGKNTQWAGRQIMVGITVPLAIAAAGAASMALKVNQEMTRVTKVYNTVAQSAAGQERELANVRTSSLDLATKSANKYGAAVKDTLDVEAQLAQTGLSGSALFSATNQAVRIATLGEMDYQKAVDMTISLQTAYKLSSADLTKSFDFMNAAENATSLSIQDIAEAVPRAGSALAGLGVNIKQTVVLLGAMKEAGVNADEAANALKSGASKILNVDNNKKALDEFKALGVDISDIAKKANGNIYDFMVALGKATHSLDNTKVEQGISSLFGVYQFNRASALVRNLGDAVSGVKNQTATLIQLAGQSSASWAKTSETELKRWQDSTQGTFKRTLEGLKASMIPFGDAVLAAVTPILKFFKVVVDGFNSLSPHTKTLIMFSAGLIALVGPALMLIGIFGNLFGNAMKFGTWIYTLTNNFKLMTPEQQAAYLASKNATSAFNTQAQSAAVLAQNIRELTLAMEQAAVANGVMMSSGGQMIARGPTGQIYRRTVETRANGSLGYAAGSVDAQGNKIGGRIISAQDAAAAKDLQARTAGIAQNAEKAKVSMTGIGKTVGLIAGLGLVFAAMKTDANSALNSVLNIAMVAGTVGMMFPGIFSKAFVTVKGIGSAIASMFAAGSMTKISGAMSRLFGAFYTNGITGAKGLTGTLASMAPRFTSMAGAALRIFGPIGILAGGVIIAKKIAENMNDIDTAQKNINQSAKNWADILGYTFAPGTIAGSADSTGNKQQTLISQLQPGVDQLKKDLPDLVNKLQDAKQASGAFGKAFDLSVQEALKVLSTGGSMDDAIKAFQTALRAAGAGPTDIEVATIRLKSLNIDSPNGIKNQFATQIQKILGDVPTSIDAMNGSWFRNIFGGNLDDTVRASARSAGNLFATEFMSEADPSKQRDMLAQFQGQIDDKFGTAFSNILKSASPKLKAQFKQLGIDSMSSLLKATTDGSDRASRLFQSLSTEGRSALASYGEFYRVVLQSLADAGVLTKKQFDALTAKGIDWGGFNVEGATGDLTSLAKILGITGNAATQTADAFDFMGGAIKAVDKWAASLGGTMQVTADQLANAQKSAMQGSWNDILGEASRQFDVQRQAGIDAISKHYEDISAGYDSDEKAQQRSFDAQQKASQNYYDQQTKDLKAAQDAQTKATTDSYDAQKKAVQDQIDNLKTLDDARQAMFDAEQKRIDRMAARANTNIDMNVALNSGNLDEAARLSVSASAQESQWNSDDAQAALDKQAKAQQDALQAQLQRIDDAKTAALDALKETQDAQQQALEDSKKRDQDALDSARQTAQDALDAKRKANDAAKASAVRTAQDSYDADKRSLAMRLKALQDFIPTNEADLRAHIGDVQSMYAAYGVNLQMQGNAWGNYIGTALKYNVDDAAKALQSDIGWAQIAANISDQIGKGTGMTLDQVKSFLTTGTFPPGVQTASPPYTGSARPPVVNPTAGPGKMARHAGGEIGFTQADRVGVPRDVTPYHSEVVALLKRGEFVVNEKATSKHGQLLQAINSGHLDSVGASRHAGGFMDYMTGLAAMQLAGIADTTFFAVQEEKRRMLAEQTPGTGPDGGYIGSGMTYTFLDAIRKQLFPGSVMTSGYRPGANDYHGAGDAIDIGVAGNLQSGLMPIAARLAALYPDATELIHNPNGSIKNGKNVPPSFWGASTWAQHANHVHWAMTPAALSAHHMSLAGIGSGPVASGTNQQIVQNIAQSMFGWTGAEWAALYQLVNHESGFRNTAQNPTSTAYGMFQFLNSTWGSYGVPKTSDPTQQAIAGLRYVRGKYGDPINAWNFWQGHRWYDDGGFLAPGRTMAMNATGKPEPVFTSEQWDILQRSLANSTLMYSNLTRQAALVPAGGGPVASGETNHYTINVDLTGAMIKSDLDLESAIYKALDKREARNGRRRVIK